MALAEQSLTPEARQLQQAMRKRPFRRPGEILIVGFLTLCAAISLITPVLIDFIHFGETFAFFGEVSPRKFFLNVTGDWQPLIAPESYNVWELVAGTLNIVIWSMVFAARATPICRASSKVGVGSGMKLDP